MKCPICKSEMHPIFDALILNKYSAHYYQCLSCEIIKPKDPSWLEESYTSAIAATDVGLVSRNFYNSDLLTAILSRIHPKDEKILDVGGGYGLLCRLLRDKGWNCYSMDVYCQNLFAFNFEPDEKFTAPTLLAFEVFEHLDDPLTFIREQISLYKSETLIFSTLTHNWDVPPQDWWYYAFETGQHISLYKRHTLNVLAQKIGWHVFSLSDEIHILSKRPIDAISRIYLNSKNRILSRVYRYYTNFVRKSQSLRLADYEMIKSKVNNIQLSDVNLTL